MKFVSLVIASVALAFPVFADSDKTWTTHATWDHTYDNPDLPLTNVACSNGEHGLITRGYTDLGSLPTFPHLGGMFPVEWNSELCGSCWEISYEGKSINYLAVDYAGNGFNMAKKAMIDLGGQDAVEKGNITVTAKQVDEDKCGIKK